MSDQTSSGTSNKKTTIWSDYRRGLNPKNKFKSRIPRTVSESSRSSTESNTPKRAESLPSLQLFKTQSPSLKSKRNSVKRTIIQRLKHLSFRKELDIAESNTEPGSSTSAQAQIQAQTQPLAPYDTLNLKNPFASPDQLSSPHTHTHHTQAPATRPLKSHPRLTEVAKDIAKEQYRQLENFSSSGHAHPQHPKAPPSPSNVSLQWDNDDLPPTLDSPERSIHLPPLSYNYNPINDSLRDNLQNYGQEVDSSQQAWASLPSTPTGSPHYSRFTTETPVPTASPPSHAFTPTQRNLRDPWEQSINKLSFDNTSPPERNTPQKQPPQPPTFKQNLPILPLALKTLRQDLDPRSSELFNILDKIGTATSNPDKLKPLLNPVPNKPIHDSHPLTESLIHQLQESLTNQTILKAQQQDSSSSILDETLLEISEKENMDAEKMIRTAVNSLPRSGTDKDSFLNFIFSTELEYNSLGHLFDSHKEREALFVRCLLHKVDGTAKSILTNNLPRDFREFLKTLIRSTNFIRPHNIIEHEIQSTMQNCPIETPLGYIHRLENLRREHDLALSKDCSDPVKMEAARVVFNQQLLNWAPNGIKDIEAGLLVRQRKFNDLNQLKAVLEAERDRTANIEFAERGRTSHAQAPAMACSTQEAPITLSNMKSILEGVLSAQHKNTLFSENTTVDKLSQAFSRALALKPETLGDTPVAFASTAVPNTAPVEPSITDLAKMLAETRESLAKLQNPPQDHRNTTDNQGNRPQNFVPRNNMQQRNNYTDRSYAPPRHQYNGTRNYDYPRRDNYSRDNRDRPNYTSGGPSRNFNNYNPPQRYNYRPPPNTNQYNNYSNNSNTRDTPNHYPSQDSRNTPRFQDPVPKNFNSGAN